MGSSPAVLPRPDDRRHVEWIGHRGAPREHPENTLPGFVRAIERGADALELDVHVTADGEVVVHHDDEIQGHLLAKVAWTDIERLDLGGGITMPRLADVLDTVGDRAVMYIELKGVRIEEKVLRVARRHGQRFALHSFDHDAMERVQRLAPDIPRGVLLDRGTPHPFELLRHAVRRTGARDVWPHWSLADAALIREAHELGARVIAWTVNSRDVAASLLAAGVDGLCTDDVRILGNH